MSRDFPALVDPWQLVRSRREFKGSWPVAQMQRLAGSLESDRGEVLFEFAFGRDQTGTAYAELKAEAVLVLLCQRTLEPYDHPISLELRLGLIEHEDDEASLPEGYEPYVVPPEPVKLPDLVEDELILALPLVALSSPEPLEASYGPQSDADPESEEHTPDDSDVTANPFAALASLRGGKTED